MYGHAQIDQTLPGGVVKQLVIEGHSQEVRDQLHDLLDTIAVGCSALNGQMVVVDDDPKVLVAEHSGTVTVTVSTELYDIKDIA